MEHIEIADGGVVIGFYGMAGADKSARARAFEDEVLALIPAHGGRVVFRGIRQATEPDHLPAEFHVLWFPTELALANYLADDRRAVMIARHGDVFDEKVSVRLDAVLFSDDGKGTPE